LLAWIDGKLIFDGNSLGDVVSEFNRYNREKMQIADASIAAFRIGGSYSATNPEGFAKRLRTFGIRAERYRSSGRGASVIVLTKSKSGPAKRSAYGGFRSAVVQS
jgi:ferric-dicitrate binding protein FerR (iron transport regulator)